MVVAGRGEFFPRIGFVVTNSRLPAGKVIKVYNGQEGKWKTGSRGGQEFSPLFFFFFFFFFFFLNYSWGFWPTTSCI